MQAGTGCLAGRIKAGNVSARMEVGDNAAARVVRSRNDRNRLARDIDPELQAAGMDVWKVFENESFALVCNIEKYAIETVFLHLEVDRTGDNIPRREFGACIVCRHKTSAIWQAQNAAFTAHRL